MGVFDRGGRRAGSASVSLALALVLAAGGARAAEAQVEVQISLQPRKAALIALARQARLSIGFPADLQCTGQGSASGRMTAAEALDRLLAGSGCRAVRLDARTFAIQAWPPASQARPSPPARPLEPASLGELIVTATKRETTLRTAPYALTALTGGALQEGGVTDTADLSALTAGVTVTNLGPGRNKLILRGLSDSPLTGHTQSTVGIYLDDLRLTYNAPDPDLPWVDVARVEVLRGPQGTLYGSGSIGGIIHIVANPPDRSGRYGWLSATLSATASGAPSGGIVGVLNQPLGAGRGALRLAGWSELAGGYIDDVATGRKNVDRTRRDGLRTSVSWSVSDDLTVSVALVGQSISSRDTHYAQPSVGPYQRAVPTAEPHDSDFIALDLALHWIPAWGDVTLNTGVLQHDVASRYDAALAPVALAPPGDRPRVFDDDNDIKGVVNEARIASRGPSRLQWLVGGFAAFGQQDLEGEMIGAAGAAGYGEVRRDRLLETALFGEASYDFGRRWTLSAGARLFRSSVSTRSAIGLAGQTRRFDGKLSDSGLAPKVVVAFHASHALTLYAQASEGYRSGGFNTSGPPDQPFGEQAGAPQPLRRYAADELSDYAAGLRWQRPGGSFQLSAAAFYADWRNIQADTLLPSGLPFTANIGDGRSEGVELESAYVAGPFTVAGYLALQKPELDRPDPGFPDRPDSGLPGVPRVSYGVSAAYRRTLAGGWAAEVAGRYSYVGHSHLTFDAQTSPRMGGYGDLRLSASASSAKLRLEVFADNLTDSDGDTFAYGNPFSLRQVPQSTPQRPRTAGLSVRRAF